MGDGWLSKFFGALDMLTANLPFIPFFILT